MLVVVQFENGYYGVQNALTGILLCNKQGEVKTFATLDSACRYSDKVQRRLNKTLRKILGGK